MGRSMVGDRVVTVDGARVGALEEDVDGVRDGLRDGLRVGLMIGERDGDLDGDEVNVPTDVTTRPSPICDARAPESTLFPRPSWPEPFPPKHTTRFVSSTTLRARSRR